MLPVSPILDFVKRRNPFKTVKKIENLKLKVTFWRYSPKTFGKILLCFMMKYDFVIVFYLHRKRFQNLPKSQLSPKSQFVAIQGQISPKKTN